jgi:hypothetical protein
MRTSRSAATRKAAQARKRSAAGLKAALTRRRRAAGRKAAATKGKSRLQMAESRAVLPVQNLESSVRTSVTADQLRDLAKKTDIQKLTDRVAEFVEADTAVANPTQEPNE